MNECHECEQYDREHDSQCPLHPDYDPSPWCRCCGNDEGDCKCGPIAENE